MAKVEYDLLNSAEGMERRPMSPAQKSVLTLSVCFVAVMVSVVACQIWILPLWAADTYQPAPPPYQEYARMARYIMHVSTWAALSTTSTHKGIEGYPFSNVFSISDGPLANSSGTPYLYLTPLELSVYDLEKDSRASMSASLAQSSYCQDNNLDPQDPVCAHIILTGEVVKVPANSSEEEFAHQALFTRHPEMSSWPVDHGWFFAKLVIKHIYLLDYFGGAQEVTPDAYYAATP